MRTPGQGQAAVPEERVNRRRSPPPAWAADLGRGIRSCGLSLLWSAIKKSKPLPGVCCSCEKKRSLCARATGFFYCLRKLFLPLWVTQGAQS